jgi:hypothetical protein
MGAVGEVGGGPGDAARGRTSSSSTPAGRPDARFPQEQLVGEERRSLAAAGEGQPEVALCRAAPR